MVTVVASAFISIIIILGMLHCNYFNHNIILLYSSHNHCDHRFGCCETKEAAHDDQ